jgi:hypothetical protein
MISRIERMIAWSLSECDEALMGSLLFASGCITTAEPACHHWITRTAVSQQRYVSKNEFERFEAALPRSFRNLESVAQLLFGFTITTVTRHNLNNIITIG